MTHSMDDPRVRKTRRGLQEAFVRLILRQGYDSISIQDIATEADAARVTFYRHYRDKEELLTDCLNTLYEELAQRTERLSMQGLLGGYSPVSVLYEHIEEQETLYRILFSSRGTQTVIERMRHHLAHHAMERLRNSGRQPVASTPLEIIANHTASAQLGLAIWWLDHDKPYPARYMAQISVWLSLSGLIETMGGSDFKPPVPQL
ncbi:MAG: TetR/AcrR family transcriptional regulator [Chloroflexota bacterium]|nr:TetR/AcrR family transcriptional regulator [Chloroflexota bacterium]